MTFRTHLLLQKQAPIWATVRLLGPPSGAAAGLWFLYYDRLNEL
jgi:hypothetical protein